MAGIISTDARTGCVFGGRDRSGLAIERNTDRRKFQNEQFCGVTHAPRVSETITWQTASVSVKPCTLAMPAGTSSRFRR